MPKVVYSILVACSMIISIVLDFGGHTHLYQIFKPLTTVLILALPIIFWNKNNRKYNYLIVAALIFCLIGDTFLLSDEGFIYGLASFLIGHLLFTAAFASIQGFIKNYRLLLVLLIIGGAYLIFLRPHLGDFFIPVLIYVSIIMLMNWQAIGLSIKNNQKIYKLIGIAAVIFSISDALIAYNKFVEPFTLSGILVLSTYWLSIFIFAFSTQKIKQA